MGLMRVRRGYLSYRLPAYNVGGSQCEVIVCVRVCLCVCVNEFPPSQSSLGFQSHVEIENSVAKLSARENHLPQKYSLL